jgi:hypothetical protein
VVVACVLSIISGDDFAEAEMKRGTGEKQIMGLLAGARISAGKIVEVIEATQEAPDEAH